MTGWDTRQRKRLLSVEEIDGFRVIKTFAVSGFRRSLGRRLLNYLCFAVLALGGGLREGAFDAVLMATDPIFVGPAGFLLARYRSAALILDERDLYPESAVALGYLSSPWLIRVLQRGQNCLRARADLILAATPGIKRLLTEVRIPDAKVVVFPNVRGFSADLVDDDARVPLIQSPELWQGRFVALYVGKLGQANDVATILRAARRLQGKFREIWFAVIGEGERRAECERCITEWKLTNVMLLGALPWETTRCYLRAAAVGVQSFVREPFWHCALSTKIFDYMQAGKPVVFAGGGDTADLIRVSGGGIVVNAEDDAGLAQAIVQLYLDPLSAAAMGERGRKYVLSEFSKERMLATMRQALSML